MAIAFGDAGVAAARFVDTGLLRVVPPGSGATRTVALRLATLFTGGLSTFLPTALTMARALLPFSAAAQLLFAPCASSARAWRLWAA